MANEVWKVHKNFIWRIENITATSTLETKVFRHHDPSRVSGNEASGMTRAFMVEWNGASSESESVEDLWARVAEHLFTVEVIYSEKFGWKDLHELMLSDRHDILKALRDPTAWVGYDADNTTDDIGLMDRYYLSSEKDKMDGAFILRMQFRCTIMEQEY